MREIRDIPVGDLMSTTVVTVTPETSIETLTELMTEHDYNGFPVITDTGRLVGLVTRSDLFKATEKVGAPVVVTDGDHRQLAGLGVQPTLPQHGLLLQHVIREPSLLFRVLIGEQDRRALRGTIRLRILATTLPHSVILHWP